ncbi:type II secretion system protein [Candidatus Parcubacteria bacterium]|jgi:prepilin-type N-terminal cleavage/methylation domain-containing protein|nr:MAG: type II secretion system protein [Candidatus Parcubacteria bacterium]
MDFHPKKFPTQKENPLLKSGAGFTLIEVIVATAVFSMAMVLATTVFVVFLQQQRRTINQQEMQNDARAVMEEIAQKLREGVADYAYYATNFNLAPQKLLSSLNGSNDECLVIRDALNEQYFYRLAGGKIQKFSTSTPGTTACSTIANWSDITPASLTVEAFSIFISPSQDPFQGKSYKACGKPGDFLDPPDNDKCTDWGTFCTVDGNTCEYQKLTNSILTCYCTPQRFGNVVPLHPKVTISLKVSRVAGQLTLSETYQTTITSRIFKNFDKLNRYAP